MNSLQQYASPKFQHAAARRRLSKPAANNDPNNGFNTQPPEGGCPKPRSPSPSCRCFNTQPPEGGCTSFFTDIKSLIVSTRSRPKAAGIKPVGRKLYEWFQHAAARRRLFWPKPALPDLQGFNTQPPEGGCQLAAQFNLGSGVSTRSRPKAAGKPPRPHPLDVSFQHAAARRRLASPLTPFRFPGGFNTQPPEGGCYMNNLW